MQTFGLPKPPGKGTMSRIFNDKSLESAAGTDNGRQVRNCKPSHVEIDKAIYNWVCDMYNKRRCVTGQLIKEKALQQAGQANEQLPPD